MGPKQGPKERQNPSPEVEKEVSLKAKHPINPLVPAISAAAMSLKPKTLGHTTLAGEF